MSNSHKHPFKFISGLLYPAVLGAMIVTGVESFFSGQLMLWKALLIVPIVLVYIFDFLFTHEDGYSVPRAIADFFIVISLYIAATSVLDPNSTHEAVWASFVALKFFGVVWEESPRLSDKERGAASHHQDQDEDEDEEDEGDAVRAHIWSLAWYGTTGAILSIFTFCEYSLLLFVVPLCFDLCQTFKFYKRRPSYDA